MLAIILSMSIVLLCGLDLWCKSYIEKHVRLGEEREICDGKIFLRKVYNKGMALNVGDKKPQAVSILSVIVSIVLSIYYVILLRKSGNPIKKEGMMWILGGAYSNCYDRLVRKYVVDYFGFKTKWKKLSDITFNLGDMFIFGGTAIYLIAELCGQKK